LGQGRPEAFAALFDQHSRRMLALARAISGSHADAEDALQQTFVDLFRSRNALARATDLEAYVSQALRRCAWRLNSRRKESALPSEAREPAAPEDAPAADPSRELERALAALSSEQREVLSLKFDAGMSFAQIGALLGIPPNTAASRYRYALQHLSRALGGSR
jgi:RNA polymerase sigma-70 factor (ECF subfamily)